MRSIWACSCCVAWLLGALMPRAAGASHLRRKETLHRVDKVYVTEQLERRGTNTCPTNHSLCPASVGGGCCPDRYSCASDSCVATTAGTTSACGLQAYYACGANDGGGCCPEGYLCGPRECSAPSGVTTQPLCPVSYYLCPSSFNYGCCQSGMGCALNACYATTPLTYVLTQPVTTTVDGKLTTTTSLSTTVTTPERPSSVPTETDKGSWPKFIPNTQPKVSEIPSNVSQGLTQTQIGGIVGGAIGLLIIILAATFLILRRLKKTQQIVQASSKKGSSSRQSNQMVQAKYRPGPYNPDQAECDDLLRSPAGARQSAATSEFSTPLPSSNSDYRQNSMDTNTGYFDPPARVHNVPGRHSMSTEVRTSIDSRNTVQLPQRQHTRHMSNASEMSDGSNHGGVGSPLLPAELANDGMIFPELPATPLDHARRRSSGGLVVSPLSTMTARPSLSQVRRRSDPQTRERSSSSAAVQGGPPLDVVTESVEQMHGYFGPMNVAAGQTGAGVHLQYDLSSPIAPRIHQQPPPP